MSAKARTAQILVAGSYGFSTRFTVDHSPAPGETVRADAVSFDHGGKGSNQAVGAARLGASVALLTALGDDAAAAGARELWRAEGVRDLSVDVPGEPTMVGSIYVDRRGENSIAIGFGAMGHLTSEHATPVSELVDESWIVLVQNEAPIEFTREILRRASARGARTILNPAPALHGVAPDDPLWRFVDYVTPNEHEAVTLAGPGRTDEATIAETTARLARDTGTRVITTVGARGALLSDGGPTSHFRVRAVEAVDTTGAGDTFNAALAVALSEGRSDAEAISWACTAARHSVQHHGVIDGLPFRGDLDHPSPSAFDEHRDHAHRPPSKQRHNV